MTCWLRQGNGLVFAVLKSMVLTCSYLSCPDTTAASQNPDPSDLWLFTDPAARTFYAFEQRLADLRQDIQMYVMNQGRWIPDEMNLKREIWRLLNEDILSPSGAFADLSPHPTIYRAETSGVIVLAGWKLHFEPGDELVYVPRPYRQTHPGVSGPVRSGRFYVTNIPRLCGATYPFLLQQNGQYRKVLLSAGLPEYSVR